jgi:hypothetical protein
MRPTGSASGTIGGLSTLVLLSLAGCESNSRFAPLVTAPLNDGRDSGFVLLVQDDVLRVETIDESGAMTDEYDPSLAEEILLRKHHVSTAHLSRVVSTAHAWGGRRVMLVAAPPGRYRLTSFRYRDDSAVGGEGLDHIADAEIAVAPHAVTLAGALTHECGVKCYAFFDESAETRHLAVTLLEREDAAAGRTSPLWHSWATAAMRSWSSVESSQ